MPKGPKVSNEEDDEREPATPKAPVSIGLPFWMWRVLFVVGAAILIADVFTRSRPDLRPAWLGGAVTVVELIMAGILLLSVFLSRAPLAPGTPNSN